jgi:hypothetical protein
VCATAGGAGGIGLSLSNSGVNSVFTAVIPIIEKAISGLVIPGISGTAACVSSLLSAVVVLCVCACA